MKQDRTQLIKAIQDHKTWSKAHKSLSKASAKAMQYELDARMSINKILTDEFNQQFSDKLGNARVYFNVPSIQKQTTIFFDRADKAKKDKTYTIWVGNYQIVSYYVPDSELKSVRGERFRDVVDDIEKFFKKTLSLYKRSK